MEISYKNINILNFKQEQIIQRDIPEHFNTYIKDLIDFIDNNKNIRMYKTKSESTQVVTNIKNIVNIINTPEYNESEIKIHTEEISRRLLDKEVAREKKIAPMGVNIKRGSVIQALLVDKEISSYKFLIAKVNHTDFIDDTDFKSKTGFSANKQNIWKTALFELVETEKGLIVDSVKIYLDTSAKYWADDFLELKAMKSDESNTSIAFNEIEKILTAKVKRKSPYDFNVLRGALIGYLKQERHVDYAGMIDEIFKNYTPVNSESLEKEHMNSMITKIRSLPEEKCFDKQFTAVPTAINTKIPTKYNVNTGIEMKISHHYDNINSIISSEEDKDGNRYIRIKTNNDFTYKSFKNKKEEEALA